MISCGCNSDHVMTAVTRTTQRRATRHDTTLTGGLLAVGNPDEFIGSSATLRENDERYIRSCSVGVLFVQRRACCDLPNAVYLRLTAVADTSASAAVVRNHRSI